MSDTDLIARWESQNVIRGSRRGAINPLLPADLQRYRAAHPDIDPNDIDALVEANRNALDAKVKRTTDGRAERARDRWINYMSKRKRMLIERHRWGTIGADLQVIIGDAVVPSTDKGMAWLEANTPLARRPELDAVSIPADQLADTIKRARAAGLIVVETESEPCDLDEARDDEDEGGGL